jgi:two-component system, NarL family, nitrate/nitrite response regulator NarL
MIRTAMNLIARAAVLIVDDHPLYRDGVVQMLARRAPNFVCRTANHAEEALDLLQRGGACDMVMADQRLPGALDGFGLLERVGALYPTAGRVLISGSEDTRLGAQAREAGLMGYLPKSLEPDLWVQALQAMLDGEPWFPPVNSNDGTGLTPRQAMILERIATGQTNKVIARELGVTERTIKYHLGEIFSRAKASSRAEAVARACALGWISPRPHQPSPGAR